VNAVLVDEADLQPADLVAFLSGRIGRFSDLDPDMVVDPTIILSLNAPYIDNWVYSFAIEREVDELLEEELKQWIGDRPLIEVFIQPGGRKPNAENLHNLPGGRGYYMVQAALNKHRPDYVARMIDNKFVPMQHGQPVNPGFDYETHVQELAYDPRRKLILGLDKGLFAAGAFCQRNEPTSCAPCARWCTFATAATRCARSGRRRSASRSKRDQRAFSGPDAGRDPRRRRSRGVRGRRSRRQ
jgi:hypothetical protein